MTDLVNSSSWWPRTKIIHYNVHRSRSCLHMEAGSAREIKSASCTEFPLLFILHSSTLLLSLVVLGSAGLGLIFRRSWLGDPNQPIKLDILYHVMSSSVLQWAVAWRKGICYSGASWASGSEKAAYCIFYLSVLLLLFSSPFAIPLNCFYPNRQILPFPSASPPHLTREEAGVREKLCGSLLPAEAKPQHW